MCSENQAFNWRKIALVLKNTFSAIFLLQNSKTVLISLFVFVEATLTCALIMTRLMLPVFFLTDALNYHSYITLNNKHKTSLKRQNGDWKNEKYEIYKIHTYKTLVMIQLQYKLLRSSFIFRVTLSKRCYCSFMKI